MFLIISLLASLSASADDLVPGVYVQTDETGQSWVSIYTGSQWINQNGIKGTAQIPGKISDTAVLWVDRNHANAIARNTKITGDGMHIFVGWYLNHARVSAYRTLSGPQPLWVDSVDAGTNNISVDVSREDTFACGANNMGSSWAYHKSSSQRLWSFSLDDGYSVLGGQAVAVSYDGSVMAVMGSNGTNGKVWVISTATGDSLWSREFDPNSGIEGVVLSSDGSVCAVTTYHTIYVWENGVFRDSIDHYGQVPCAISGDGSILATARYDGRLRVFQWNGSVYSMSWQANVGNSWATAVAVSRDGSTIACGTGYANGSLLVFDASSSSPLWTYAGYGGYGSGVWAVALSGDGSRIAAASYGDTAASDTFKVFTLHDRTSSVPLLSIDGQTEPGSLFSCDISDDGQFAVAGGKAVHAYQMGNGGEVYSVIAGASASTNAATEAITVPTQFCQVGTAYGPTARFANLGDNPASFSVHFRVDTGNTPVYTSSDNISNLASGDTLSVEFSPQWTPDHYDLYTAYAWTELSGDGYSGDDTLKMVIKCFHDAQCLSIDQPHPEITLNQSFTPGVSVKNNGSYTESQRVILQVLRNSTVIHADTQTTSTLAPNAETRVVFDPWSPSDTGSFTAKAWTVVGDDFYPANDTVEISFTVKTDIIYDDGSAEAFYIVSGSDDNNKFAVRFTPTLPPPLQVSGGKLFLRGADALDYVILCPDAGGLPDTASPYDTVRNITGTATASWVEFLFDEPVQLPSSDDVWLVIHWSSASPGSPAVGADNNWLVDQRSWWFNNSNGWNQFTWYDWMFRLYQGPTTGFNEASKMGRFWVGAPTPNPCVGSAVLRYYLPAKQKLSVKLYTVDGRLAKLVCDETQEPGLHVLRLGSGLKAGMYFIRMKAGDRTVVRKMIITR